MTTLESRSDGHLIPVLGDLPISNARYFTTAVVTRVRAPAGTAAARWLPYGSPLATGEATVDAVAFSPDGESVVGVSSGGEVQRWSATMLEPVGDPAHADPSRRAATLRLDADGSVLSITDGRGVEVGLDGHVLSEPEVNLPDGVFSIVRVASTPTGSVVVAGRDDGSVWFWHGGLGAQLVPATEGHQRSVSALAISGDGELAASGSADGAVRLWNPRAARNLGPAMEGHEGMVMALAVAPDHRRVVSAGDDGTIRIWDASAATQIAVFAYPARPSALAIAPDATKVAVGGDDGAVSLWYDATGAIVEALDPQPPGVADAHAQPAEGVLLTHEQGWFAQGIALGELLHSVSLAPGEITQLAVTNHSAQVAQSSVDAVTQTEDRTQAGSSSGSLTEREQATAVEAAGGTTTASSSGATSESGAGGLVGFLGLSSGSAATTATGIQASFANGTRNVADESNQNVHQGAQEAARLARQRYSAAVREVSESDSLELQTRVVANYNHMHTLNLQFYEVVQVNRLQTRVTDAQRLLFVPMTPVDFSLPEQAATAIARYRHQIADTARALGLGSVATCIDVLGIGDTLSEELRSFRLGRVWSDAAELSKAASTAAGKLDAARTRAVQTDDAVLKARDALRNPTTDGLAARAAAQRTLDAAQQDAQLAAAQLAELRIAAGNLAARRDQAVALKAEFGQILALAGAAEPADTDQVPTVDAATFRALERRVFGALAQNQLSINQGLWMRIDPSTYAGFLAGRSFGQEPLAATVDPTPVAVAGNAVGFRWHHRDPQSASAFVQAHVGDADVLEDSVTLPTGGIFGEAVLGTSNAADTIDITRFWNWSDSLPPIRPAEIDALQQPDDQKLTAPTLPAAPAANIDLGPVSFPQVASGIPTLTEALANPELFSDLSGTKTSAALARSAMELSSAGADKAADLAAANYQRHLKLQNSIANAALDRLGNDRGGLDATMAGAVLNARRTDEQGSADGASAEGGLVTDTNGLPGDGEADTDVIDLTDKGDGTPSGDPSRDAGFVDEGAAPSAVNP